MSVRWAPLFALILLAAVSTAHASGLIDDAQGSVRPPQVTSALDVFVFTAPPREKTRAEAEHNYKPIVDLLSKATGKHFVYEFQTNWLSYETDMRAGKFDVVFDGPHFTGWRMLRMGYTPLLRLPQPHVWVVTTLTTSPYRDIASLAGRRVCVHAPPNFGTLTLLSLFDNPSRIPYNVEIHGWKAGFDGVLKGKCDATILPITNFNTFNAAAGGAERIIFKHDPYPNQAFSASPRVPAEMQHKILEALMSPEGREATKVIRDRFCKGQAMVPATKEEYAQVGLVLRNYYGFEF